MKIAYKFAVEPTTEMAKRIAAGTTTSVLGIPGAGITLFLKHLAAEPLGRMIYVDVFKLPSFTTLEFYKGLLRELGDESEPVNVQETIATCQQQLKTLAQKGRKVVICVAGFDQLQAEFSAEFFQYLRSLRGVDQTKIVFVFGICRRLDMLLPADLVNADLNLFSSVYYLKPYKTEDLQYLLATYGPKADLSEAEFNKLILLSGGHFQFLQLLIGSENRANPVQDPFIHLAYKNIFAHLSGPQKAIVRKLATEGSYSKNNDYLTNIGIVKKIGEKFQLFSPLFAECVRAFSAPRLPLKEQRLLSVLKRNEGRTVPKQVIYDAVWRDQEIGSEWALNALVYRLRKHPAFLAQNFVIENHKKRGYVLELLTK